MGHFDPKWQERLQEYVVYPYMDLFYPSTKRYYINYSNHPHYADTMSFIALNFSWKLNTLSPYYYKLRPKFRKVLRSSSELQIQMDKLKPRFLDISHNLNLVYFFPTSFLSTKTHYVLNNYLTSLIFLLNIFTKNRIQPDLSKQNLNYLFYFLNNICILNVSNSEFIERIVMRAPVSYLEENSYESACFLFGFICFFARNVFYFFNWVGFSKRKDNCWVYRF